MNKPKVLDFDNKWSFSILSWYQLNKRTLPWRDVDNPYFVWLSEVILQQTRIDQGTAYYFSFIKTFPTIEDLANADEQEVLRLWQGLGYYSRARALHETAKYVASHYDGVFPLTYNELIKLKGIGPYTAAAIASIAGKEDVIALDGNVYRLLARSFGIEADISIGKTRALFLDLANTLLPSGHAGDFNQAMMDIGATICKPKTPNCTLCPVNSNCFALTNKQIPNLPVKSKKIVVKVRYFHYFVIEIGTENLWLKVRNNESIWAGLWEFPVLETETDMQWQELREMDDFSDENGLWKFFATKSPEKKWIAPKHQLTHQTILANFYKFQFDDADPIVEWLDQYGGNKFTYQEISNLPKPVLIVNFLENAFKNPSVVF